MAAEYISEIRDYIVDPCPICGKAHTYKLKVSENKVLLFGGGRNEALIEFTCLATNQTFQRAIPVQAGGEIEVLESGTDTDIAQSASATAKAPSMGAEFEEWIKNSRSVALDFCKTMISISAGAIPVYFAVLNYLGFEKVSGTQLAQIQLGQIQLGQVAILPPILYLAALLVCVLALRPPLAALSANEFAAFRESRLNQLNRFIIIGTSLFVVATGLAIAMFSSAMVL
jgi:hypothetical protein